jgi:threonine dehydrogenase-like Zn-dependent dehydrogenase
MPAMTRIPSTCRAAVMTAPAMALDIVEVEVPAAIEPGALLVKIDLATLCGSDVHILEGAIDPARAGLNLPVILGHEMVGRVAAFGDGSRTDSVGQALTEGDRVIWSHGMCGQCMNCVVENQPMLCASFRRYMTGNYRQYPFLTGGLSEYGYVFPTSGRVKVPDEVSDGAASAASCALRSVVRGFHRLGPLEYRHSVVVQGSGPLGLFAVAKAVVAGARQVTVIGGPPARLELARAWGATHTIDVAESTPDERLDRVRELTGGRGADAILEMSGAPEAFAEGMNMVRAGGRYLIVGQSHDKTIPFNPSLLMFKHATVIGSLSASVADFWESLDFMRTYRDRFTWDEMVSGFYPLEKVNDAFANMAAWREIKPAVTFS